MVVIAHVATDFKQNPPAIALINSHMATRYPLSLNADILVTFVTDKFSTQFRVFLVCWLVNRSGRI
jgi:hypothetical protein